jgi:hypothetical protein
MKSLSTEEILGIVLQSVLLIWVVVLASWTYYRVSNESAYRSYDDYLKWFTAATLIVGPSAIIASIVFFAV